MLRLLEKGAPGGHWLLNTQSQKGEGGFRHNRVGDGRRSRCDNRRKYRKLAGVPVSVVKRARVILKALEDNARKGAGPAEVPDAEELPEEEENPLLQISIAGNTSAEIMEQLKNIDVNTLTPIESLTLLHELVRKAKG